MSINWVMLSQDGEVVKLPGEKIVYKVRSRIGLDLCTPKALPNATPFSVKSDSGIVYITNHRVIYLPARPTDTFKSFSAPILDFEDTRVASSFFGPWSWNGIVRPTASGGIPTNVPRLEFKLTFKEGGHDAFQSKFEIMKERLSYARTLQQETGQIIPTGEDLPKYEATQSVAVGAAIGAGAGAGAGGAGAGAGAGPVPNSSPGPVGQGTSALSSAETGTPSPAAAAAATATVSAGSLGGLSQIPPDEPPPDYEEAQAQAIEAQLELDSRDEAERS